MTKTCRLLAFIILAMAGLQVSAQTADRPIMQAYALEGGYADISDSYLSPVSYRGGGLALTGMWAKYMPCDPERLLMQFDARIESAYTSPHKGLSRLYDLGASVAWGVSRVAQLPFGLRAAAGANAGVTAGCLYLPVNSNNPADARLWSGISLKASLSWRWKMGYLPFVIHEEVSLPTLGAFFRQQYAEPYYEIWLGNHRGLWHCGWWGNHFCLDNLLCIDLGFQPSWLRLGYRFRIDTDRANHINVRTVSHSLVIGVVINELY